MGTKVAQPDQSRQLDAREAVVGLLRAADKAKREVATELEPFDITGPQYNVLRILRGEHPDAIPTLEIASRVLEQTPGITRMLDRLEAKGLVSRWRDRQDRRKVMCAISEVGLALLERLDLPVAAANERAVDGLTLAQLRDLVRLLGKLNDS